VTADTTPAGLRQWANLAVPGHHGTPLATDVHVPPQDRWPVPVVVTRTPYGRTAHLAEGRAWRARGLGYAVQDVRGRYDSDGTWTPYRNERADGAALVDWLVRQPWCDGRIITYGGSYSGYTAWTAAVERPAAVVAVISMGPSMGLHRTKFTRTGILRLAEHAGWWLERADGRTSREGLRETVFSEHPDVLNHLPVSGIAERLGARLPHWHDALHEGRAHGYDGTPPEAVTDRELAHLRCAALHVGGWYDLLVEETLHLWRTVGSAHGHVHRRDLLIGPWGHDLGHGVATRTGDLEHGPRARVALGPRSVDWIRRVLDDPAPQRGGTAAEVFAVGAGRWLRRSAWPPSATDASWHPQADGALDRTTGAGWRTFDYDPAHPFPSCRPALDRSALLHRDDAARFSTGPLPRPLGVEGVGSVDLDVETSGEGTDWVVRVLEHRPDGGLFELCSGTAVSPARGRHRHRVVLTPITVVVGAGSSLVLEITSSDFPYLARHLNTAGDRCTGTTTLIAQQTVHLPGTRLDLPVATPEDADAEVTR
jgi:hypothetical protein